MGGDLSGSLRLPASFCGVYSIRPSVNRLTRHGGVPELDYDDEGLESFLTSGAFAQNIEFLELFMECACDKYKRKSDKKNIRVAVTKEFKEFPTDERVVGMNQKVIDILKSHDIFCEEITPNFNLSEMRIAYDTLTLNNNPNEPKYEKSRKIMNEARKIMDSILESYDIWICPCSAVLPYPHNPKRTPVEIKHSEFKDIKYWRSMAYTTTVSLLGNPVLTQPVGMIDGLPIGVQVVGKRNDDEGLLQAGRVLEKIFSQYISPPDLKLLSKM